MAEKLINSACMQPEPVKACTKCKRVLPLSAFWKDRQKKDGRTSRCGECSNVVHIAYYWANRDRLRAYHKAYKDNPKRREANNRYDRERWKRDPGKMLARLHLNRAVKRGLIARLPCHKCGDPKSQGHHHDYSKPLEVEWLCQECHALEHRGEQAFAPSTEGRAK